MVNRWIMKFILDQVDELLEDLHTRMSMSRYESSSETCRGMRNLIASLRQDNPPQTVQWSGMNNYYQELLENMPLIADHNTNSKAQSLHVVN